MGLPEVWHTLNVCGQCAFNSSAQPLAGLIVIDSLYICVLSLVPNDSCKEKEHFSILRHPDGFQISVFPNNEHVQRGGLSQTDLILSPYNRLELKSSLPSIHLLEPKEHCKPFAWAQTATTSLTSWRQCKPAGQEQTDHAKMFGFPC